MRQIAVVLLLGILWTSCQKANGSKEQMLNEASLQKKDFAGVNFELAYDPVCKMSLSSGVADTVVLNNKTYGFCRSSCKQQFLCAPDSFLK